MTHPRHHIPLTSLLALVLLGLGAGSAMGQEKLTDAAKGELLAPQIATANKYIKESKRQLDEVVRLFEEPVEWSEGVAQSEMWGVTRKWLDNATVVDDELEQIDMSADEPLSALSPAVKEWWMRNFASWRWLDTEGYTKLDEYLKLVDFARRCRKVFIPDAKKVYAELHKLGKAIDDHLGTARRAVKDGDPQKVHDALLQLELDILLAGAIDKIVAKHIEEMMKFRGTDPALTTAVKDASTWFTDWGLDAATDPVFWAAKEKMELAITEANADHSAAWREVMDVIEPIHRQKTPFPGSEYKHIRGWENEKMQETLQKEYDALKR